MKILTEKFVIAAFVLSLLIVLGAHLLGRQLYNTEREPAPPLTDSVPNGEFANRRVNSHGTNTQEYGVPDSKSPDSTDALSSSEWHEGGWNLPAPERISEITEKEREAALRQIRREEERIKELQAGLPPLLLTNPDQFRKELKQHLDKVINETEQRLNQTEKLLRATETTRIRENRGRETSHNSQILSLCTLKPLNCEQN